MKRRVLLVLLLCAAPAGAQTFSITPSAGTLGFGDTNLEAERARTENDIRDYKVHPVVTIGLTFGF